MNQYCVLNNQYYLMQGTLKTQVEEYTNLCQEQVDTNFRTFGCGYLSTLLLVTPISWIPTSLIAISCTFSTVSLVFSKASENLANAKLQEISNRIATMNSHQANSLTEEQRKTAVVLQERGFFDLS